MADSIMFLNGRSDWPQHFTELSLLGFLLSLASVLQ